MKAEIKNVKMGETEFRGDYEWQPDILVDGKPYVEYQRFGSNMVNMNQALASEAKIRAEIKIDRDALVTLLRTLEWSDWTCEYPDGDCEDTCPTCGASHHGPKSKHEPDCALDDALRTHKPGLNHVNAEPPASEMRQLLSILIDNPQETMPRELCENELFQEYLEHLRQARDQVASLVGDKMLFDVKF